jgi:hypothetical protein
MKALKELLSTKEHESAALYEELLHHEGKLPEIMRQFNELDARAVELAAKMRAAVDAGSPTWISIESDLRRARWARDAVKATHSREGDRIRRALQTINGRLIQDFHLDALQRLKDLSKHFRETQKETYRGQNDKRYAIVQTNDQAIENARDQILKAIVTVRAMQCRSLSDLRAEIERQLQRFDGFEFDTMVEKIITLQMLRIARDDRKPDRTVDAGRVNDLNARINALERTRT